MATIQPDWAQPALSARSDTDRCEQPCVIATDVVTPACGG
jgi:hypothetical protein